MPIVRWIGGDQFRKLCILSLLILLVTVWITCAMVKEDERPTGFGERRPKLRDMINTIHEAVLNLPKPVRRICMVQIAAFMGWFPFLFYATTYVENVMSHELGREADGNDATRAGSLALLIYSFGAFACGGSELTRQLLSSRVPSFRIFPSVTSASSPPTLKSRGPTMTILTSTSGSESWLTSGRPTFTARVASSSCQEVSCLDSVSN